jgi:hypothetical protein
MRSSGSGLNLTQVLVLVFGLGTLSALISPALTRKTTERKMDEAQAEATGIRDGILKFRRDTGRWPTNDAKGVPDRIRFLCSGTSMPSANPWSDAHSFWTGLSGEGDLLDMHLGINSRRYDDAGDGAWAGPYGPPMNLDPWRRPYVVNIGACASTDPVLQRRCWVISAGPNGRFDTNGNATIRDEIAGDDIGLLVLQR